MGYTLISNHAFVDGNKRIGLYVMLSFLEMNGIRLRCTDQELVHIGLSIADGSMGYEELLQWVIEHKRMNPDTGNISLSLPTAPEI